MADDHEELPGLYAAVRATDRHIDVHQDESERVDVPTGIRTDRDYDLVEHREMAARSALVALRSEKSFAGASPSSAATCLMS